MNLLELQGFGVSYRSSEVPALDDVSFGLKRGERLAVLGESGSGKSTLAMALVGLLPPEASLWGRITWPDLAGPPVLGRDIGFVFQDPAGSLDPLMQIGDQVAEVLTAHQSDDDVRRRTLDLLDQVQLPDPRSISRAYPHQLSGGQKQRVAIACAIAIGPSLLIADEPTSALDTVVQAEILKLLGRLVRDRSMTLLLVTHDIAVAAQNADRIAVLQSGRLMEIGARSQIINDPKSDYTRGLVASHIALDAPARVSELVS